MNYVKIFLLTLTLSILTITATASTPLDFNNYFSNKTMRIDYHHIGDSKTEIITIDKIYQYNQWAGSTKNLIDNFNNGRFYIKIHDPKTKTLIYSKGFDSYFGEYQLGEEAANGIKKTFHESAIIPYPKEKVTFTIEKRNRKQLLDKVFSCTIDPNDVMIIKDKPLDESIIIYNPIPAKDPHNHVDLAFIAEGYTKAEEKRFKADMDRFTKIFFSHEPYKSMKDKFNIYGVLKPSAESGIDEPRANIFKNTVIDATFNSMGSERYLLTENNKSLRDIAGHVPYDALLIMVNHKRYGGGGIYNFYCTFTTDNQFHAYLMIHEFGHSFSGLADEYYTSATAYNDFYPRGLEPVEPNITALLDPQNLKWKDFASQNIKLPTPWEKEVFDTNDMKWQKLRREMNNKTAELKRNNAPIEEIKKAEDDYAKKDKEHSDWVNKYLQASKYWEKVGAFEGAGYSSQGLYRPMLDCIMFSKGEKPYCKVCEAAIGNVIKHYCD